MRPEDESLRPVLLYEALRPHYYGVLFNNGVLFETWRRCGCCTPARRGGSEGVTGGRHRVRSARVASS